MKQIATEILSIFIMGMLRYFTVAGALFLVVYKWLADRMSKSKIQLRAISNSHILKEMKHSVISTMMLAVVAYLALYGPLRPYTQIYKDADAHPSWWIPLSVFVALVIHDTYFYWMHRTIHHDKIFKHIHLTHHLSVNPTPFASYSFHAIEAVLEAAILAILVVVIPMHPKAIASFALISFIINVYGHLGYEIMPKWFRKTFLFEILNTSCHHNLHHKKFKGNYGLYFRVWDRIMGTEHPDYVKEYDRVQAQRFGS
jgi:lathosterol oxidase